MLMGNVVQKFNQKQQKYNLALTRQLIQIKINIGVPIIPKICELI